MEGNRICTSHKIREWVFKQSGRFHSSEIRKDLGLLERKGAKITWRVLKDLCNEGLVEKTRRGTYIRTEGLGFHD